MCLEAATQERTVYACTLSKEKEGKGSLTYDVLYIDTDLTKCTVTSMFLLHSNIGALKI